MNIVSVELNFMVGYVAIGIVSLYMLIRFLIIAREMYYDIKIQLLLKLAKRAHRKQRKILQKTLLKNHTKLRKRLQLRRVKQ